MSDDVKMSPTGLDRNGKPLNQPKPASQPPVLGRESSQSPAPGSSGGSRTMPAVAAKPDSPTLPPPLAMAAYPNPPSLTHTPKPDDAVYRPLPSSPTEKASQPPGHPERPASPQPIQHVQSARPGVPDHPVGVPLAEFQYALKDWIAALEKELPAATQQSALSYLESNFDRLSMDLHERVNRAR